MAETAYICLDTEFVNNVAIIELSVFSIADREIYHHLFRPAQNLRWTAPPDKLKITPAMVADKPTFASCLSEIQTVFDSAKVIIGYAVDNDISMLRKEGVKKLDRIKVVEVRDLYWLVKGRDAGVDLYGVPNLLAITNELGLTFDEDSAHFASSDTRATLYCFHRLMELFCESHSVDYNGLNPDEAISLYERELDAAKKIYRREQAHGYAVAEKTDKGYKLKVRREMLNRKVAVCVEVADRSLADYDMAKQFARREVPGHKGLYNLREADLAWLRAYTNVYDEENAEMMRKLMKFKGRLSF